MSECQTHVVNHDRRAGKCTRCRRTFAECGGQMSCDAALSQRIADELRLLANAYIRGEISREVFTEVKQSYWKEAEREGVRARVQARQ